MLQLHVPALHVSLNISRQICYRPDQVISYIQTLSQLSFPPSSFEAGSRRACLITSVSHFWFNQILRCDLIDRVLVLAS